MKQGSRYSRRSNQPRAFVAIAILLAAAGCAGGGAAASGGSGSSGAPSLEAVFAGTWAGPFTASVGEGDVVLVVTREGGVWGGNVTLSVMGESVESSISDIELDGNAYSFTANIEGAEVYFTGSYEEEHLNGSLVAYVDGQEVGDGTYMLARKNP